MTGNIKESLEIYVRAALGRKAVGLVALDMRALTSIADVFIICSGRSNRQVSAIAEFIIAELKKQGVKPLNTEGLKGGHWVLIDYGHVIIHVFYEPVRHFYDLEGLWVDAKRIETKSMKQANKDMKDQEESDDE